MAEKDREVDPVLIALGKIRQQLDDVMELIRVEREDPE